MKTGLCVIGYGGMGSWHSAHALKSDVVELVGIYDIKEERCLAAEKNGIKAFRTLDEVLSNKNVELVTVATPNNFHKELVIKCLEAGKNVISEKPVTMKTDDLRDMIEASKKAGKLFTVHQNRRWDVDYLAIKKLHDSGVIGDFIDVESRIHGSRGIPSDWRGIKENGGGMLYDWGIHLIDQIMCMFEFAPVKSVYCDFDHITNNEVDDGFRLTLRFKNGARAYVEVGTYNFISMPRFYVRGKKGSAKIEDWRENCRVTECFAWHESDVVPVQTAAGLTKTMAPRDEITTKSYELPRPDSDVHDFYRNVCAAIHGKEGQLVTHEQMLTVLTIIEKAFESDGKKIIEL